MFFTLSIGVATTYYKDTRRVDGKEEKTTSVLELLEDGGQVFKPDDLVEQQLTFTLAPRGTGIGDAGLYINPATAEQGDRYPLN